MAADPLGKHITIPDLIEPIVAWRGWKVEKGFVISPQQKTIWENGALSWDLDCGCKKVETSCLCGINSFKTRRALMSSPYCTALTGTDMVGEVALWGQVREFEGGWRAEHAKIVRVWAVRKSIQGKVRAIARVNDFEYMGLVPLKWRCQIDYQGTLIASIALMLLAIFFFLDMFLDFPVFVSWTMSLAALIVFYVSQKASGGLQGSMIWLIWFMLGMGFFSKTLLLITMHV